MRRIGAVVLLLCVTQTSIVAQAGRCGGGTAQYLATSNGDTVSAEGIDVGSSTVQSQLQLLKLGAVRRQGVAFGPGISATTAYVDVWQPGSVQSGPPNQHAVVTFAGNSAQAVVMQGSRSQVQADAVEAGTLPFMNGSVLYLQLIAMRAAIAARDTVRVPLLWLFSGGQLDTAYVSPYGRDSISIRTGVGTYVFARDADGTLGGGRTVAPAGKPASTSRYQRVCP